MVYLQGNGLPCYNPATGNIYAWSEDCCVDCDACVERKSRGEWNANSPYGYKCEFKGITSWGTVQCSTENCEAHNISYIVQANDVLPAGSCNWIKNDTGGIGNDPPDLCSVPNADGRYVEIVMSYSDPDGLITVTYRWGGPSTPDEIVYTKTFSNQRIPCLELTEENIGNPVETWASDEFCDPTSSYCELTDL